MPIDPSIALAGKGPQIDNPLNYLLQAQQIQGAQNQNAMFPLMQQEQQLKLIQAQRMNQLIGNVLARRAAAQGQPMNALSPDGSAPAGAMPGAPQNALAPQAQQGPQGMGGNDYEDLAMAGYAPAEKAWMIHKEAAQGSNFKPGETYVVNGRAFTVPLLDKGMQMGANGVEAIPGYSAANAGIVGAAKGAETGAVNANTPADPNLLISDGQGGMKVAPGATRAEQMAHMQGGQAQAPSLLDRLPPAQAAAIRADMAKNGIQSATVNMTKTGVNGVVGDGGYAPAPSFPPQMQQVLIGIAASRDPARLQQFTDATMAHISQQPDSPQKQAAVAQLQAETQKIAQSWGGKPSAPAGALASPTDIAVDKEHRLAGVKMETDPLIKFKTDLISKAHDANVQTYNKLGDTVRSEFEIMNRNKQLLPLLDGIQTGGFAPEQRIDLANKLQTSGLVPDALKGKLATWMANGAPTTGKVIENQLAAAGIKTMLETLDKEGKPNRAIFDAIHHAQESVNSGNATLKQVFDLQKQLYDMHYQQEQEMGHAMAAPTYNPMTLSADFSKKRNDSLKTSPAVTTNAAAPAVAAPPANGGFRYGGRVN